MKVFIGNGAKHDSYSGLSGKKCLILVDDWLKPKTNASICQGTKHDRFSGLLGKKRVIWIEDRWKGKENTSTHKGKKDV